MRTKNILVALMLLLAAGSVSLAAENPLTGTWKLNESKSKYASDSAKNTTVTYTAAKGDMIKCTAGGVDKDGKPIHWTWTGKLDGKPYPIKGSPAFDTLAYHPMNERTNETTARKDGKVVMTAVIAVAKDGKSRTVTLIGTDAKGKKFTDRTYYDKQQ
jgi:Na+-translocating ferredoxin:NAD+ oxidoreductase RnfG subunit